MATEQASRVPPVVRLGLDARAALALGALAELAIGTDHIQQYYAQNYSTVPTIGALFLLNFISSVALAIALVVPLRRVAGHFAVPLRRAFAVGGIGLAAGSLAGLLISETSSLFGFTEHGYRLAIALSVAAEVAAIAFLGIFLVTSTVARRSR
jgi:hypothetical protein